MKTTTFFWINTVFFCLLLSFVLGEKTGKKEELEAKTKELSDSLQKVGEAMSKQPQTEETCKGEISLFIMANFH